MSAIVASIAGPLVTCQPWPAATGLPANRPDARSASPTARFRVIDAIETLLRRATPQANTGVAVSPASRARPPDR